MGNAIRTTLYLLCRLYGVYTLALNLITTKLMAPRSSGSVVERPRLLKLLETWLGTRLILISAPAGSGKSTLLASWLKTLDRPAAWLSLDMGDNDLERFLLYLVSALQKVDPQLGKVLPDLFQEQGGAGVQALITQIINDVAGWGRELVLVLDDYHAVTDPEVHRAVEFLLEHLPPGLCLVMATRTDPPLALSRLRVRRQVAELRGEQLRFSLEETAAFLNSQLNLELSARAISNLEERTEGWVAGLQLAALSLEGRGDKEQFVERFAGSHRYLVDYLVDEVLSRQAPEMRQFLQQTSILERFTVPLCQAVTRQSVSAKLLQQLEAANLFLIPLDDERRWYRYHHLFAEFLRHRLQDDAAGQPAELHRRASEWLEGEGWSDEAIHHALAAQDFQRAGRLVETIAFRLGVSWNNAQLIKHAQRLPLELLPDFPRLCIYYGWALINTGRVEALGALIQVIERSHSRIPPSRAMRAALLNFRACQHNWRLEFSRAVALCQEALGVLGGEEASSDEERWLRVTSTNMMAYSYLLSDIPRADGFYPTAFEVAQRFTSFAAMAGKYARHGRVKHQLGSLTQAMGLYDEGLLNIERWKHVPSAPAVNAGELHVNLARLLYEMNRLDEAEIHLQTAGEFNRHSQFPPVLALELETAAWLALARGQIEAAQGLLGRLNQMLSEAHPGNLLYRQLFGVMGMNLRLNLAASHPGLGHLLGEVGSWIESRRIGPEDGFSYPFEGNYAVLARYLVAQGKSKQALPLLERLIEAAGAEGRRSDWLRYCILKSLAAYSGGQEDLALQTLQTALRFAESEGFCRSFVDQGASMQLLLRKLSASGDAYAQKLLAALPRSGAAAAEGVVMAPPLGTAPPRPSALTERELDILRLLAGGNSNKEIGRVLNLAPETVKWYVKGLYEKLEVGSRIEATNRARELGLL